jgi:pilus assembly protein CpaC
VSKAVNLTSLFYGQPGLKVITGPGGNMVRPSGNSAFQPQETFSDNMDINILQGSVVTDMTGNVVSMLEVAHKPQIRCSIKILDISRTALRQLGSNLLGTSGNTTFGSFSGTKSPASGKAIANFVATDTGTANNLVTSNGVRTITQRFGASQTFGDGVTQVLTLNQQFSLALSALEEKRKVRSLAEPTLTFLSGEKASFLAGGEVPIPVLGTQGQISITYHEFGIRLNLIATVTDDGKINMLVAPEVSSVDPANAVTTNVVSVPGFKTRRMQTTLELENGQSFIMAGLFNQEETESVSRLPGLGSVPILGSFFRNSWGDKRENEMVVIIRPEISEPGNNGPIMSGFQRSGSDAVVLNSAN